MDFSTGSRDPSPVGNVFGIGDVPAPQAENIVSLVAYGQHLAVRARQRNVPHSESVAVIGAGLMGTAIATACLEGGLSVRLVDKNPEVLQAAEAKIETTRRRMEQARRVTLAVDCATDLDSLADEDLVIESIVEEERAKRALLDQVVCRVSPSCLIATNTSTIPIARLVAEFPGADRFCGIHFFHPVQQRPLLEIIRGPATSDATVSRAIDFAAAIQKLPIVVADGPGFVVNRLLLPYLSEALELLLEGNEIEAVEEAALDFGMPMGPLRVVDEIGIDTTMHAGRVLWEAFPDRVVPSPLMIALFKKGRLGRKAGKGFFRYGSPDPWRGSARPDPDVAQIFQQWKRESRPLPADMIQRRLLLPMVLEAVRLLEEGLVRSPRDIDLAVVFGLGFPQQRGGLLYWADSLGPRAILETVESLADLGPRMEPPKLLRDMARRNLAFYG